MGKGVKRLNVHVNDKDYEKIKFDLLTFTKTFHFPINQQRPIDTFISLAAPAEGYYMDKGSKFHAYAYPVESEAQATAILHQLRKTHPKARHFCTALRLFPDASLERSNDDGEPSGSAGKPILGQMIRHQITNALIVVVRYFGGTKLGVPGLIEAYKTSAGDAIQHSSLITKTVYEKIEIEMEFENHPFFMKHLKALDILLLNESYTHSIVLTLGLRKSMVDEQLLMLLKKISQRDYPTETEYCEFLRLKINRTHQEIIF